MIPELQFLEVRERFLPVRTAALRARMLRDARLSGEEREWLDKLVEMVAARIHVEYRAKFEHLKALYEPFDPDGECAARIPDEQGKGTGRIFAPRRAPQATPASENAPRPRLPGDHSAEEPSQREELARSFERLLLDANYVEMSREQVVACAQYQSQTGLMVEADLADYAELRVFCRGMRHQQRTFRPWLTPWKRQGETMHVFSRVAMLVRLARHPTQPVFLKLFKNVVAEELEMLLPYVRIRMRLLDHVKIGSSMVGGLATASWKAFTAAALLSPWVFLLVMTGFMGALVRGVFSFLSNKTRYMQALTASLYFQNLANNSSALAHLVDAAEQEECKELLLAYYLLYLERDRDYTQEQLDRRVEQWLKAEFALDVDFEISDAVRKLCEKQLLVRRPAAGAASPTAGGVLKVYDLPSALRRLDETWDGYYRYNGALSPEADRVAEGAWPPHPEQTAEKIVPQSSP